MSEHLRPPQRIDVHLHLPDRMDVHVHVPGLAEVAALIVKGIKDIKQEIRTMGETTDQALGEIATGVATLKDTIQRFETDVTAALGQIATGGSLTPAQQAAVDSIKQSLSDLNAGVGAADAALPHPEEGSGQVAPPA